MSSSGTVKFYNGEKGFGFITPSNGGEDVFVHRNDVTDEKLPVEGDTVYFDSQYDDRKGKYKAGNVSGGTGGHIDSGGKGGGKGKGGGGYGGGSRGGGGGGSSTGTVKFFNSEKGFGFITPSNGGEDVFVHMNDISDGQTLQEGDSVYFDSQYDDRKGKYKAGNVTGGSGGGGGGKGGGGGYGSYGGGGGGGYRGSPY